MRVNYHDSLLPGHAGYFSTTWAILAGTAVHGVTWHLLEGDIDTGPVLVQREVPVADDDTVFTLNTRCFEAAVESFTELVGKIEAGDARATAQDLTGRTFASLQTRPFAAGLVDWHWPAETISRFVRALDFGPTANPMATPKTVLDDAVALIESAEPLSSRTDAPPGTITAIQGATIRVTTGDLDVTVRLGAITHPAAPLPAANVFAHARVGHRLTSPDPATADRIRQLYEAAVPAERRTVERLTTLLGNRPAAAATRPPSGRRHRVPLVLDDRAREAIQRHGWDTRAAVLTAWHAVVCTATGATTTEAWWADDRLRAAAADATHTLSHQAGAAFNHDPTQPVAETLSAVAGTLRGLSTSRPSAADIVNRYPDLRRLADRSPTGIPAAIVGNPNDRDAELAAHRDTALIERAGDEYELDLDADRWPREPAEMLVARISAWLAAAAVDVGRPVGDLVVLGEPDRRLLARVNDT
ncbi:formyltransferase family protein, partial [Dactylosporangium sp. NPDC051485]|uniref:methionyl-tRNA formyltransferase n=1 Tax=Dactylosporangium sp. NPDC051485 TaxID=3154846 RepID=UPI003414EBA1